MSLLDPHQRRLFVLAKRLVPARERQDWQREWEGELAALAERVAAWPEQRRRLAAAALKVALHDALWLRLHPRRSRTRRPLRRPSLALHAPVIEPRRRQSAMLARDLAFGLRRLRRSPGFSLMVIGFLALSIAATTVVFALVRSIVLTPLAYADSDRLVRILAFDPAERQEDWLSMTEVELLLDSVESLDEVAFSTVFPAVWQQTEGRRQIQRGFVSEHYFSLLGRPAFRGRLLTRELEDADAVVLAHDFWRRHWQDDDDAVLGQRLIIDEKTYTIVGVAAPTHYTHDFSVASADVWLPWPRSRSVGDEDFRILTAIARIRPGLTLAEARAEIDALEAGLASRRPQTYGGWQLVMQPLKDTVVGGSGRPLLLLFAALGLLMLGICANLANLVMVRLLGRRGELAIHLALGGQRGVIARQLSIESVVLSATGGLMGLGLAHASLDRLLHWLPFDLPRVGEVGLGWPALVFALTTTVAMALLFGWLPAMIGTRSGLAQELQSIGRGASSRLGWLRRSLIVVQVALALPLLIGASLLVRSLLDLQTADLGLQPAGVFATRVSLPFDQYPEPATRVRFFSELLAGLRAHPSVVKAGASLQIPFRTHQQDRTRFEISGQPTIADSDKPRALLQVVTPGYLETLGTRILAGRAFDERDRVDSPPVMMISEELRRRHFPDRSPLGQRLTVELILDGEPATRTVVGVVEDIAQLGPAAPTEPLIFLPHAQASWRAMAVVMRLSGAPAVVLKSLRADVARAEPSAVVEPTVALPEALRKLLGPTQAAALLVGAFAAVATALSLLGLYGLLSYDVAQSRREIAIRMAVGATSASIQRQLLLRSTALVALGTLIGLCLSIGASIVLRSVVFGLSELDPSSFLVGPTGLLLIALLASWLPAARAASTSPADELRGG